MGVADKLGPTKETERAAQPTGFRTSAMTTQQANAPQHCTKSRNQHRRTGKRTRDGYVGWNHVHDSTAADCSAVGLQRLRSKRLRRPAVRQVQIASYSSMLTSYECVFEGTDIRQNCDYAVRICTDYIRPPRTLETAPPHGTEPPSVAGGQDANTSSPCWKKWRLGRSVYRSHRRFPICHWIDGRS